MGLFTKCGFRVLNYQSSTTLSGDEVASVGICPKHTRRSPNIAVDTFLVHCPPVSNVVQPKGKECRIMTNCGWNIVFSRKHKPTAGQTTPTMQYSTVGTMIKMFRKLSTDGIRFAISVRGQLNREKIYIKCHDNREQKTGGSSAPARETGCDFFFRIRVFFWSLVLLSKLGSLYSEQACTTYVCMVTPISRVWINRVWLPILLVVS